MIVCIQTRFGVVHYINWSTHRGVHYTMCGKAYTSRDRISTYGIDQSIPQACPACRAAVEPDQAVILDKAPQTARGDIPGHTVDKYAWIQMGYLTPKDKYEDLLKSRYWPKKNRMQRKRIFRSTT